MNPPSCSLISEISQSIDKLRQLTQLNVLSRWRSRTEDLPVAEATQPQRWLTWEVVQLNAKQHIAWPSGRQVIWLGQQLVIPQDLQGYPLQGLSLRLALTWWAEDSQIFVNGARVQEGDLFDASTRVLLSTSVATGEVINIALRLVSPGHDAGALVRSVCVYERTSGDRPDPGFVADELAVLQKHISNHSDSESKIQYLKSKIDEIDIAALPDPVAFERSLARVRRDLLENFHTKTQIHLLGHAHLDLAWLWPVSETWSAAQRTFESVLQLMQDFPELTFCHSTPALYAWIELNRPELFAKIQQQVADGRWEIVGGLWVEPELNIIGGESIVRQVLYGQRYCKDKFNQIAKVAWLPDSFGFTWQLPQIFTLGGIEYFVTQKLRWNDTTKFPHEVFWWQAPDGSLILSLMSAPIGEGIEPVKMANYACEWQAQTGTSEALWLPGVGDHGGGPTRDMLEVARTWQKSPFFPKLDYTTAEAYLSRLEGEFPIWNDELYLEFHRGCYTTHADQKRWNRRCEELLYQAELFASLATLVTGASYPKGELEDAWKKVLFNQFHDILPGSSIPEVYVDANQAWEEVERVGMEILDIAMGAIASKIAFPSPPQPEKRPIVVFNPLNWSRSEVVAVELPAPAAGREWQIYDINGQKLQSQFSEKTLLFQASDIPSIGYRIFWLVEGNADKSQLSEVGSENEEFILENELLRVVVDSETGDISSVFDKIHQREVLSGKGNQLQAFRDSGQYWDAWNIDPNYAEHPLPAPSLENIQWLECGLVRSRLRVVRYVGESEFCSDYIIEAGSPLLKIETSVDWRERHVLVKAAFPLNLEADYATYEIPCGAIARSTRPVTPAEKAKWEVSALRWADLTHTPLSKGGMGETSYGVSLLNDCKYGYDAQPSQLRLTLLKSPNWPNPEADKGSHKFTYALYPHSGSWQSAGTVRRGYELNLPLLVRVIDELPEVGGIDELPLQPVGKLLDLGAENLILMAFKQSEDDQQRWILRCYECHGEEANLNLRSDLGLAIAQPVDLLERSSDKFEQSPDGLSFRIAPWKIASFGVLWRENLKSKLNYIMSVRTT